MDRWVGKVAVVTAASHRVGAAITIELVKAGMIVVGLAKRKELVEELRELIPSQATGKLYAAKCDVSKELDIIRVFGWILAEVGGINVLVNNAEVQFKGTITNEGDENELKSVLETNLWAAVLCTKKAVEMMKRQRVADAHIININSPDGHEVPQCGFDMNLYPVSKFGMTALTEVLCNEFRFDQSGIKTTSISPSKVCNCNERIELCGNLKRPKLHPSDVAEAVLYVLGTPKNVQIAELKQNAIEKANSK